MGKQTKNRDAENTHAERGRQQERDLLQEIRQRPSDSVDLVGETAASEALTDYKPIGPSEAESRNALGLSPVEPEQHRHASRRKPR